MIETEHVHVHGTPLGRGRVPILPDEKGTKEESEKSASVMTIAVTISCGKIATGSALWMRRTPDDGETTENVMNACRRNVKRIA